MSCECGGVLAGHAQPTTSIGATSCTTSTVREAQRAEMRRIGLESPAPSGASMGQATSGVRPPTPRRIRAQRLANEAAAADSQPSTAAAATCASAPGAKPSEGLNTAGSIGGSEKKGAASPEGPGEQGRAGSKAGQTKARVADAGCHELEDFEEECAPPARHEGPRRVQAQRVLLDDD